MVIGPRSARLLELAGALGVADRLWQTGFVPDDRWAYTWAAPM